MLWNYLNFLVFYQTVDSWTLVSGPVNYNFLFYRCPNLNLFIHPVLKWNIDQIFVFCIYLPKSKQSVSVIKPENPLAATEKLSRHCKTTWEADYQSRELLQYHFLFHLTHFGRPSLNGLPFLVPVLMMQHANIISDHGSHSSPVIPKRMTWI